MKTDCQLLVDEFFAMIRKLNRTGSDIMYVRDFFWKSSEIRGFIPPTVELMTVLKAYSPVVFHEFRKSLVPQSSMHILASVYMETGEALINLGITSIEQLELAVKGRVTKKDTEAIAQ